MVRRLIMPGLITALIIVSALIVAGPAISTSLLRNDQIHWHGTAGGLMPGQIDWQMRAASIFGRRSTENLMTALDDENRYVAAHVLLGSLYGQEPGDSGQYWDGLLIDIFADGRVVIPDQREAIRRHWKSKLTKVSSP